MVKFHIYAGMGLKVFTQFSRPNFARGKYQEFCVEKNHKNLLFSRHVPNTHGANFFPKWAVPKFHIYLENLIFFPKFLNFSPKLA